MGSRPPRMEQFCRVGSTIGGEHCLSPDLFENKAQYPLGNWLNKFFPAREFFASGRDAFYSLVLALPHMEVWLPAYLCESLIQPVVKTGRTFSFYPVDEFLKTDMAGHSPKMRAGGPSSGEIVLVVNFFGVVDRPLYEELRRRRVLIISDVTHSLFDLETLKWVRAHSDFVFASLRKLAPFPDLAFSSGITASTPLPLAGEHCRFWAMRSGALLARNQAKSDNFADMENVVALEAAEKILDASEQLGHRASIISQSLLDGVDVRKMIRKTRENSSELRRLLAHSRKVRLLTAEETVSPYVPIVFRCEAERDEVREKLKSLGIYCPVHWKNPLKPHLLSTHLLSIPSDYRYSAVDMQKLVKKLLSLIGR